MIRSSILMGRNFYIRYRNVPKEQVLPENKYNNGVGNWNKDEKVCGNENFHNFKEKLILSEKLFLHSLHFFSSSLADSFSLTLSSPHKNGKLMYSCAQIQSFFFSFIGEKRSYDRINCLLKTRFNIDN